MTYLQRDTAVHTEEIAQKNKHIYRVGQKSDILLVFEFPLLQDALYLQVLFTRV